MRRLLVALAVVAATAAAASAKETPEQTCQRGRSAAGAKYAACQLLAHAKYVAGGEGSVYNEAIAKCRAKYAATWIKLRKKAAGTNVSCDGPRFVDNGDGTVSDRLTGFQWEQKTDDGGIHDVDNAYRWSSLEDFDDTDPDGTVFTDFLATLNATCFAGRCDWRLPTRDELATIFAGGFFCAQNPCIDTTLFGPTTTAYWTATESTLLPSGAWSGSFTTGGLTDGGAKTSMILVRAVRGGL